MSSLFKDVFNQYSITHLATIIVEHYPAFDSEKFLLTALNILHSLEMKARSQQIVDALNNTLPEDFPTACDILINSLAPVKDVDTSADGWTKNLVSEDGIGSWMIMPCADFIAQQAHNPTYFEQCMQTLHAMTKRFSAEFAIRPFIVHQPDRMHRQLQAWVSDPDKHVRRLVSEGSRPLLPWGIKLHAVVADPTLTLHLLEQLKNDKEDYVRLSVANHLNDIAKHHPDKVTDIARAWLSELPTLSPIETKQRHKLIKHACRTLIKQGHKETLALFGLGPITAEVVLAIDKTHVSLGDELTMTLLITNQLKTSQDVLIDYVVYHQKANGSLTPKVFKWKHTSIQGQQTLTLTKTHSFKPITTRKYHPGEHHIAVQINGDAFPAKSFYFLD